MEELDALNLSPEAIGILKEGPVKKWLVRQEKWNKKFASTKRDLQRKRARQLAKGYVGLPVGEKPPPTALAGMRTHDLPRLEKIKTSWGLAMWTGWGSKHDQIRVKEIAKDERAEEKAEKEEERETVVSREGRVETMNAPLRLTKTSRSRSRSQSVVDQGQANGNGHLPTLAISSPPSTSHSVAETNSLPIPEGATQIGNTIIPATDITSTRPTAGGIAYPFKLKGRDAEDVRSGNASMMTLDSAHMLRPQSPLSSGVQTPLVVENGEVKSALERPVVERFETAREVL
jgi:hypothetical protein